MRRLTPQRALPDPALNSIEMLEKEAAMPRAALTLGVKGG